MTPRTFATIALPPPPLGPARSALALQVARRVQQTRSGTGRAVEGLAKRMNDTVVLLLLLAGVALVVADIYARLTDMSERALAHGAPSLRRAAALVLRAEQEPAEGEF